MKWCLVGAGLKDLSRPAEKLSLSQNLGESDPLRVDWATYAIIIRFFRNPPSIASVALTATGFIWVRYSFVITPVNYSLAAVRPFLIYIFTAL